MEEREFVKAGDLRICVSDIAAYGPTKNDQTKYDQKTKKVTVIGKYHSVQVKHIQNGGVITQWIDCGAGDEGLEEQTRQLAFLDNIFKPKQL